MKRKAKAAIRFAKKKKEGKLREEAKKQLDKKIEKHRSVIRSYGYEV